MKPYVEINPAETESCVDAFFGLRLQSIGVLQRDQYGAQKDYVTQLLNRQVDFLAALPALGAGNAIELRFVAHPSADGPGNGRVDVLLRVRVSASHEKGAREHAESQFQGLWASLLGISEDYAWQPIVDQEDYRSAFFGIEPNHIAELFRRDAVIELDRLDSMPPRRPIGISQNLDHADAPRGDASVYFVFPFLRNRNTLERLFFSLLLQSQPVAISIALSPSNLVKEEFDLLVKQLEQCERYGQLPVNGPVTHPAQFLPPRKAQAASLLTHINRAFFTLRDDCLLMKIQVASSQPIAPTLMESLGVSITEHVASSDTDGNTDSENAMLAGGYDWTYANSEEHRRLAQSNLERITFSPHIELQGPENSGRLRRLVGPAEASCAFRFPIPIASEFPGVETRLAKTVSIPKHMSTSGLYLGDNVHRGISRPVHLMDDDRRRHMYVVGQTGTGKSTLLHGMIMQDICNGRGVGVLDPHGELVDEILHCIPEDRVDDVIYINPEDQSSSVGLNLLDYIDDLDKGSAVNHLLEIFEKLYDLKATGGPMFEMYLRNSALLAMEGMPEAATLVDVMKVFSDEELRKLALHRCDNLLVQDFWREVAEKVTYGDWSLPNMRAYVTSKFSRIVYNKLMSRLVLQRQSTVDMVEVLNGQKILLVDLCKGKLGETNSAFLGMVLISLLQRAAFSRTSQDKDDIKDFYLYVDEFQNLATDHFISILSEARKYRLNLVITNQYLHQIPENIRDAVLGNVGTFLGFRVGMRDAEMLDGELSATLNRSDLASLPNFQAYLKTLVNGQATKAFSIETRLHKGRRDADVVKAIKERTLAYSRSVSEVDDEIRGYWEKQKELEL